MKLSSTLLATTLAVGALLAPSTAEAHTSVPNEARPLVFKNEDTGNCLARNADNNAVTALCDGSDSQQWQAVAAGDAGIYYLRNVDSELCLHAGGGLAECAGLYAQWILSIGPTTGHGYIVAADNDGFLANEEGTTVTVKSYISGVGTLWAQSHPA
ncbi:RICIN domain-containing protein [Streptomyces sp. NPDC002403]